MARQPFVIIRQCYTLEYRTRRVPTFTRNFLCTIKLVEGIAYTCPRAIIDLKAIPRLLRLPFVSPRPVAPLAVSPTLSTYSLGSAIYSYRRHIRSIISKGVSTRLGKPRNRRRWERRTRMEAKAVSRVEKYFSRRLRARPLRTSPILPFVFYHPFGGRSPPMLALFLTLFHSEKLSLRSRAYSPVSLYVCTSAKLYVCAMRTYACVCVCVNDARTMALNWRLTGEQ